jgi:hypothetical protein
MAGLLKGTWCSELRERVTMVRLVGDVVKAWVVVLSKGSRLVLYEGARLRERWR